jgi:opacity protein-like surface antigen
MQKRTVFLCLLLSLLATSAWAQYRRPPARAQSQPFSHRIEITPFGGYSWTISRRVNVTFPEPTTGDIDVKSSPYWGIEVDVTIEPGAQLALLYTRQDSDLTFKRQGFGKETVTGMSVEYFQIGGVGGLRQGNLFPFGMLTLGATRYAYDDIRASEDTWKFSMIFGLGAKVYANDRIALRVQGRMPFTFFSGGAGIGCGFNGCYTTVGGSGIAQLDVSAGLAFLF